MEAEQEKPTDLSMRGSASSQKKVKYIPPPLDLNARTLVEPTLENSGGIRVPKSPGDMPRECLPIRKRHLVDSYSAYSCKSPKSAGPVPDRLSAMRMFPDPVDLSVTSNGCYTAPNSPLVTTPSVTISASAYQLTPSSATPPTMTHFPVPPPLIPVPPGSGNAVAAMAAGLMANAFTKAKTSTSTSGFPTPPTDVSSPFAWTGSALAAAFSPLPFPVSSLLSPTASSHPSSISSSREDLQSTVEREIFKRRILPPSSHFDSPASPLWSFGGTPGMPTPVWQCFLMGVRVKFLLPNTDAPWQKSEELAWKDHVAMKIDARNSYQYAPNGLILVQVDDHKALEMDAKLETLMRFSPAHLSGAPDILVEVPIIHPFLVKDKGWCSLSPKVTSSQYGIRCHELTPGDICLPPNHPEAIRTPDLCDRFKRFEFTTPDHDIISPSPRAIHNSSAFPFGSGGHGGHTPNHVATPSHLKSSPPPSSPAKLKKEKDCDKPKRPMNGFMLFAKKYRLELIQQHPGKDNRAISVLLGEAWKSLPNEERESYSNKAKVLADEQKKIYPDCWKRKKTVATTGTGNDNNMKANQNHTIIHPSAEAPAQK